MPDLSVLFVGKAMAQALAFSPGQPDGVYSQLAKFLPAGVLLLIIYFLFLHKKK